MNTDIFAQCTRKSKLTGLRLAENSATVTDADHQREPDTALASWLGGISTQLRANLDGSRRDDALTLLVCRKNLKTIAHLIDRWADTATAARGAA